MQNNKKRWMRLGTLAWIAMFFFVLMGSVYAGSWSFNRFESNSDWEDWDWDDDWDNNKSNDTEVRYNRVEGVYLGYALKRDFFRKRYPNRPFLFGESGYSFGNKEFQYQAGLEKGFMDDFRLAFGAEYHHQIETPDRWIIPQDENSLAAFLLKEDFYDYYLTEGYSFYITQNITPIMTWSASYHVDDMDSCKKTTNWALFGGRDKFRSNPYMSSGEIKSVKGEFTLDTRNSKTKTTHGWYAQAEYEQAGEDFKGDYDFKRFVFDIRRYQSLGYGDGLDVRIRLGSGNGNLPWQRTFQLGGISTMRGFKYKELSGGALVPGGNRMMLAQIEYRMGSQDLPDEIDMGLLEHFNLIVFSDFGWVESVDRDWDLFEGFDNLTFDNLKNDIGIALANRSGNVRFEIARRTDTAEKPFVFYFRINRAF